MERMYHSALVQYDLDKLEKQGHLTPTEAYGKLNAQGYGDFLRNHGLTPAHLSRNQYLELIALDDWGSILTAIPGLLL
jgi:hypothetical protein